jgi:hypothetical protein
VPEFKFLPRLRCSCVDFAWLVFLDHFILVSFICNLVPSHKKFVKMLPTIDSLEILLKLLSFGMTPVFHLKLKSSSLLSMLNFGELVSIGYSM